MTPVEAVHAETREVQQPIRSLAGMLVSGLETFGSDRLSIFPFRVSEVRRPHEKETLRREVVYAEARLEYS